MTRHNIPNPFALQSPIGASIANLGAAIFGGRLSPSEQEKQQLETDFLRARTDTLNADLADDTRQAGVIQRAREIGEQIPRFRAESELAPSLGPGPQGSARLASAQSAQTRAQDQLSKVLEALSINQLGAEGGTPDAILSLANASSSFSDDQRLRAFTGAGKSVGKDQPFSLSGQEDIRAANLRNQIAENAAKISATPLSRSEFEAQVLAGQTDEFNTNRLQSTGIPTIPVLNEAGQAVRVPRTVVGMGAGPERAEIVNNALGAVALGATKTSDLGLNKPVASDVQRAVLAMKDFNIVIDTVVDTAKKNPNMFGLVGNVLRLAQDFQGQASALASAFSNGKQFEQISAELAQANVEGRDLIDPEFFDPDLANLPRLATLAAYQAAAALAQQTGRALSDKDFILFRQIVGDPTDFFSTQPKFLSGMKLLREVANRMLESRIEALEKGLSAGTGGSSEDSDDDSDEAILKRLGL